MFGKPPLFSGEKKEVLAKCLCNARFIGPDRGAVAPFTGAWIETKGLHHDRFSEFMSHPLRVRGLKPINYINGLETAIVAPFTGAWIETLDSY